MALFYYYSMSLFIGGFIALVSGAVVYISNRRGSENIAWAALTVSTAVWSFGYFTMINTNDQNIARLGNLVLHYGAIFIPLFYFVFILALTDNLSRFRSFIFVALLGALALLSANTSPLFVQAVIPKYIFHFAPDAGPLYIYFPIYFFGLALVALSILGKRILRETDV